MGLWEVLGSSPNRDKKKKEKENTGNYQEMVSTYNLYVTCPNLGACLLVPR